MSSLEQEVRTLQKQVRRQRRWNIALGALVVVGGLMAATAERSVPDVIQAKKFQVVNDEGKLVVLLKADTNGGSLTIANNKGKLVAGINADADGGNFRIRNKDGKTAALIDGDPTGGSLNIFNKERKTVALIAAGKDGGVLSIVNKDGEGVALIAADANGNGAMQTYDSNGRVTSTTP